MKRKKEDRQLVVEDEEARELLTKLYQMGHNLADCIVEQVLKEQIGRDEREDIIHDGFVRMLRNIETVKSLCLAEQMSYMCKAVRSAALDEARKLSQRKHFGIVNEKERLGEQLAGLTPEEEYIKKERAMEMSRNLRNALVRLNFRDRELLIEKYRDERSDREIGERLGIKTEQVRVYIARARKRLANFYMKEEAGKKPAREDKTAGAER